MKKILVIGSTVVDVIITLEDHLPRTQEDVHVVRQKMSLGGCAYNTSDMIRHFGVPYTLFSPIGTGAYGDFVRTRLRERNIDTPIPTPDQDNGCCYCFIEKGGERTFISYHGAEYRFRREWFSLLNPEEIESVYICGLEIEEETGIHIVEWLEANPQLTVYFAPGPRINRISPDLLSRIFALHPILHLNEEEVCSYAAQHSSPEQESQAQNAAAETISSSDLRYRNTEMEQAVQYLYGLTGNTVIVTLGRHGSYYQSDSAAEYVEGFPAQQTDTIGAGDSHIGAVIACRHLGMSFRDAVRSANLAAAKVVETEGAQLSDESFAEISF